MSNTFSLDDIRAAAEAKYGSTDIEVGGKTVRLLNPLRLSKAKRDQLTALQDEQSEEGTEDRLADTIRIIAEVPEMAEHLLATVGDDLAILATILEKYNEGTKVGEA